MKLLAGFLILIVILLLVLLRILKVREVEQENQLIQEYMSSLQDFYSVIQDRIEAVRKYRHDLAKHIQTLEHLLSVRENPREIQAYMANLTQRYDELRREQYCGDEVVNAVLSVKKQQCDTRGIPLEFHVGDGDYSRVKELHMVGLLHNLLDNAMEANEQVERVEDRYIRFCMEERNGEIWIMTENRIRGERITFVTSKKNKEEHGLGTKIIDTMIREYAGRKEIEIDYEQHLFRENIYLGGEREENRAAGLV